MEPLLQVINVGRGKEPPLSFTLMQGEAKVLRVGTENDVPRLADILLGRTPPPSGLILFRGRPLSVDDANRIGWVAADGGLISGLTIWENVTLPLCYHRRDPPADMEERLAHWLGLVGIGEDARADFLSGWPTHLGPLERRQAGLARGLLHGSPLLLVEGKLFADVPTALRRRWELALASRLDHDRTHGLLVVAQADVFLPWAAMGEEAGEEAGRERHVVEPTQ